MRARVCVDFQVRPPLGPGGYVREDQYRVQSRADASYKMQPRSGDTRPSWRVAW